MRADARANRTALIRAARRLYTERGPQVPYSAIAEEAAVGIGTLYRHFPTQEDLALALVEDLRDEVHAVCARWHEAMTVDPVGTWPRFVADVVGLQVAAYMPRVVESGTVDVDDPAIAAVRDSALSHIGELLELAKGAGLVDPAISTERFQFGLAITSRPLPAATYALTGDLRPWLVEVYLRGLRPSST